MEMSLDEYHERLKNDKEIVLAALKQSYEAIRYVPEFLRKDKDVLAVVEAGRIRFEQLCVIPQVNPNVTKEMVQLPKIRALFDNFKKEIENIRHENLEANLTAVKLVDD